MKRAKATGKKHLILIHGRATKPSEREKREHQRLVKKVGKAYKQSAKGVEFVREAKANAEEKLNEYYERMVE